MNTINELNHCRGFFETRNDLAPQTLIGRCVRAEIVKSESVGPEAEGLGEWVAGWVQGGTDHPEKGEEKNGRYYHPYNKQERWDADERGLLMQPHSLESRN